jgi:CBS domain-containing protein
MSTVDAHVSDLPGRTAADVITVRGKELAADATVADARTLFASGSVRLIPLLDGDAYVGAVTRDDLAGALDADPISDHARSRPPITTASTSLTDALAVLNDDGGRRLVVLGDDRTTYLGLVCLHRDRQRLCIDAECHAAGGDAP